MIMPFTKVETTQKAALEVGHEFVSLMGGDIK